MTLYEKRGRRYHPVADTEACTALTDGHWLVTVQDGTTSCRAVVEPDRAGFLAAAETARRAMVDAARRASDARPRDTLRPGKERRAWEAWKAIMGDSSMWLTSASAWDVVQAGLDAVKAEGGAE